MEYVPHLIIFIVHRLNYDAEDICKKFEFFPQLHKLMATRPNVVPICLTTGTGPSGAETIFVQRPDNVTEDNTNQLQREDTPYQTNQASLHSLLEVMKARGIPLDDALVGTPPAESASMNPQATCTPLPNTDNKSKSKRGKALPKTPATCPPKPSQLTKSSNKPRPSVKKTFDQLLSDSIEYVLLLRFHCGKYSYYFDIVKLVL